MNIFDSDKFNNKENIPALLLPQARIVDGGLGVGINVISDRLIFMCSMYSNMRRGDVIEVFLEPEGSVGNSNPVIFYLFSADDINKNIFLSPSSEKLVGGWFNFWHRITRIDSNNYAESIKKRLWIKLDAPGGIDFEPSTPTINENLAIAGLPINIINNGVSVEDAKKGIPVTISPYENMHERDVIKLSWGGLFIEQEVAANDVGNAVTIIVNENIILRAGDSNNLLITYEIRDEVYNSSKWSPHREIIVEASQDPLLAPIIQEANDLNIIDLNKLDRKDVTVQIVLTGTPFVAGDQIELLWNGTTANGLAVNHIVNYNVLTTQYVISLKVPYNHVSAIVLGQAVVYYRLRSAATGQWRSSKRVTVHIDGQLALLPAPKVAEAIGNTLNADLSKASVNIPAYPTMSRGDKITLMWMGTTVDGESYNYLDEIIVSNSAIGLSILFTIDNKHIKLLANGEVDICYRVTTRDGTVLESDVLNLLIADVLTAPVVLEADGNELDPEKARNFAQVRIPAWLGMNGGSRLDVYWQGKSTETSFSDWLTVPISLVGKPITFRIAKSYVDSNINSQVQISYKVTETDGNTRLSDTLALNIRRPVSNNFPAPKLDEAKGDKLDPNSINKNATLRIKPYINISPGDMVDAYLKGISGWNDRHLVVNSSIGNDIVLLIPDSVIIANNNTTVGLYYEVTKPDGAIFTSEESYLDIATTIEDLALPVINQAVNGVLDPDDISIEVTMRIPPYPQMARGDMIYVYLEGEVGWDDYILLSQSNVGNEIDFYIPKDIIQKNIDSQVTFYYKVEKASGGVAFSERLLISVQKKDAPLAVPVVAEAQGAVLDPLLIPAAGATVRVIAWQGMSIGDGITLHWQGSNNNYQVYRAITGNMLGKDVLFTVPKSQIMLNEGLDTVVSYIVTQINGNVNPSFLLNLKILSAMLPAPLIKEANGDKLNPDSVIDGATVLIAAEARLQIGDIIELKWRGNTPNSSTTVRATISAQEVGRDIHLIIDAQYISSINGAQASLEYTITRKNGLIDNSPQVFYTLERELGRGALRIMGARSNPALFRAGGKSSVLQSRNPQTGQSSLARWRYNGDREWKTAAYFRDTQPWRPLNVESDSRLYTIKPMNFTSTGSNVLNSGKAAFVAMLDILRLFGWGDKGSGGLVTEEINYLFDFVSIGSTRGAMAVLRQTGRVMSWGAADSGGELPRYISQMLDLDYLASSGGAFAVISRAGKLAAWGDVKEGGELPNNIASLNDVKSLVGGGSAFAGLRTKGQLIAWGNTDAGGALPSSLSRLSNVKAVAASFAAFAALTADNRLVGWGNIDYGADIPVSIGNLNDIKEIIATNARAFVAKRNNGQLVSWGANSHGGILPSDIAALTDVIEVVSTWSAFIGLRENGAVVAWGNNDAGAIIPREISLLKNIVQVAATSAACAVLTSDGEVRVWGDARIGGDNRSVSHLLVGCRAIYSNTDAFVVLTEDKRVVSWGNTSGGGNNSITSSLTGKISYE